MELVDAARRNEHEVEDRHHAELQVVGAIAEFPECEAGEETVGDVDSDFVPDVVGVAPQCDESTFRDQDDLVFDWGSEISGIFVFDGCGFGFLGLVKVDLVEFVHRVLVFWGGEPLLRPVSTIALTTLNHVNNVLCGVCVLWAWSAVACEVVKQYGGVATSLSEVSGTPTLGQQDQDVECLEQGSRWLMDRANDCLARCCESAHESTNFERRLSIKAGSRLVKEQQRRFRDQLSREREPFALFD